MKKTFFQAFVYLSFLPWLSSAHTSDFTPGPNAYAKIKKIDWNNGTLAMLRGMEWTDDSFRPATTHPENQPQPESAVRVTNMQQLRDSMRNALPGDTITLADGLYDMAGSRIETVSGGTPAQPITVRAENPGNAIIQTSGAEEAFQIYDPYYVFENLQIEVNGPGSAHAYKINPGANDITIRGGRMILSPSAESGVKGAGDADFESQPDNALIENTEIYFTAPSTRSVAEGIDAVGVRNWTVRNNVIHGIRRAGTGMSAQIAYAIILKGNSQDSVVENNLLYDNFISISIGGSTGSQYCRDDDAAFEHRNGTVRNNVMLNNVDVAIYLENATGTRIYNNTAYNSYTYPGGNSSIDNRLNGRSNPALYTADIRNNLLDKDIHNRGATLIQSNNVIFSGLAGYSPIQFLNTAARDLHVPAGSALSAAILDQGTSLNSVLTDHAGAARPQGAGYDVGAYELSPSTPPAQPVCGNQSCETGETTSSCPADCSLPPPPEETPETISLVRQTSHGIPGFYLGQIGVADFDEDGLQDVAIVGSWGSAYGTSTNGDACNQPQRCVTRIRLFRNTSTTGGNIEFVQQQEFGQVNACKAGALVTGDFNGDGRADLAYQFHTGTTDIRAGTFLNQGSWNFTQSTLPDRLEAGTTSLGITVADVDQNGRDDLLFNSSETYNGGPGGLWYRYNAANQWESRQSDFNHYITYGGTITAGDLTGDGYPEVAIGGNSNQMLGNQDCRSNLQYGHVFQNSGTANASFDQNRLYALRANSSDTFACHGSDNAAFKITDIDGDGKNDIVVAGSAPGFGQPQTPGYGSSHYSLSVMFNQNNGTSYQTWQNAQIDMGTRNGYTTNSGVGNVEVPNIAVGDLNGDGKAEIFVQGHRRNQEGRTGPYDPVASDGVNSAYYIHQSLLMRNNGDRTLTEVDLNLPNVGEGGQAIADFNRDGKEDLIFGGALIPWHSNGRNCEELNTASTIITEVYRNASF